MLEFFTILRKEYFSFYIKHKYNIGYGYDMTRIQRYDTVIIHHIKLTQKMNLNFKERNNNFRVSINSCKHTKTHILLTIIEFTFI